MTDPTASLAPPPSTAPTPAPAPEESPRALFARELPAKLASEIRDLESRLQKLQHQLDELRGGRASVRVEITREDAEPEVFFMNLADGGLRVEDTPAEEPVLSVRQTLAAFLGFRAAGLHAEIGLVGGASSSASARLSLTRGVVAKLRSMNGTVKLLLTRSEGEPLTVESKLGPGAFKPAPDLTITLTLDDYRDMLRGKLPPQVAFMSGKMRLQGDMGLAMKIGTLMV